MFGAHSRVSSKHNLGWDRPNWRVGGDLNGRLEDLRLVDNQGSFFLALFVLATIDTVNGSSLSLCNNDKNNQSAVQSSELSSLTTLPPFTDCRMRRVPHLCDKILNFITDYVYSKNSMTDYTYIMTTRIYLSIPKSRQIYIGALTRSKTWQLPRSPRHLSRRRTISVVAQLLFQNTTPQQRH